LIFFGREVFELRKHVRERIVHPNIDRSERLLDLCRGSLDGVGIGDVGRDRKGLAADGFDLPARGLESLRTSRKQTDMRALLRKLRHGRAADPGRCSRDDDDFGFLRGTHCDSSNWWKPPRASSIV